jgi:endoglucanase
VDDWQHLMETAPSWIMTRMYGVHSLLLAEGIDPELQADLTEQALAHFEYMLQVVQDSPYGLAIDAEPYWWNNSNMLEHAVQFIIAHILTGDDRYADAALRQMGYVLGCNPMDYCYVSGFGSRYPRDIWHAPSANDGIDEPVPGFVVPGPCLVAWGPRMLAYREENNLPVMKTYVDDWRNYSVNEVCLTFNAPMVFAAGYFAFGGTAP